MPIQKKPVQKRTVRLIPGRHKTEIPGMQLRTILKEFQKFLNSTSSRNIGAYLYIDPKTPNAFKNPKIFKELKIRIYKTPEKKLVIHAVSKNDGQEIYEAINNNGKIRFSRIGGFSTAFETREISEEFRGKGLGEKALKAFLAISRKNGLQKIQLRSSRKSTLIMLLKSGFTLQERGRATLRSFGISNEAEFFAWLKRPETPENLSQIIGFSNSLFDLYKSLRKENK